ncbi:ABC transporter substrate-binding protein [Bradyrhizobium sp. NBAIM14]|uniref:ABC transporter substrate-binding protein n=1 Tax=Bradyrhizobium sp. NBAIM14 TaxID=2793814 RepID=UPI001CD1A149|nr:ABC transporter substrate-binding protein [Bradyrhizobium sp. NBAIM14]MCA1500253.1 ABC transporter substrate-binding protein [Bradyrhizobium sp. NBAIM14]
MGRWKTIFAVVLTLLVMDLPAEAQVPVIRIGVVATFTGFGANEGQQFRAGVSAAQNDLRQIANRPVEVIFYDHQNKPDIAVNKARQLIEADRVNFLIAKGGASVMLAVSGVSEQQQTPTVLVGLSKGPFSDQRLKYSFHIGDSAEQLAKLAVRYAKDNQNRRTSYIFESQFYAEALSREAQVSQLPLQNWNGTAGAPAIVFMFGGDTRNIRLDELPSNSLLIGGISLLEIGRLGNQIKVAAIAPHDPSLREPRSLPNSLRDMKGADAYYGYAALQILARAARNDPAPERVAASMRADSFDTVLGQINFMAGGECRQPKLAVYVMNDNGSFQLCPDCGGVHDGCNGSACKCKDGSCNNDCCNK